MIQLVRHLRRPETPEMTVEQIPLDRRTEPCGAAFDVNLPAREEDERTPQRNLRICLLQRYDIASGLGLTFKILLDPVGLLINWFEMLH
jgi:hypothetical protein